MYNSTKNENIHILFIYPFYRPLNKKKPGAVRSKNKDWGGPFNKLYSTDLILCVHCTYVDAKSLEKEFHFNI